MVAHKRVCSEEEEEGGVVTRFIPPESGKAPSPTPLHPRPLGKAGAGKTRLGGAPAPRRASLSVPVALEQQLRLCLPGWPAGRLNPSVGEEALLFPPRGRRLPPPEQEGLRW